MVCWSSLDGKGSVVKFRRIAIVLSASFAVVCLSVAPAAAQVEPQELVDQVSFDEYQYCLAEMLYTHDGDNRGYGAQHDMARDNIRDAFLSFGLWTYLHPFTYQGNTYYNVVGVRKGLVTPGEQYIVGAHFDSANTPGADDNGSGTAGVIELARIFTQYDFEDTLIFIAFDREEQGLVGSSAYANQFRNDNIRGMISMDMIAYNTGMGTCDVYGRTASDPWKNALASAVNRYSNLTAVVGGQLNGSDHAPFESIGKQAALIIEDWGNPCYHRACDSVDTPDYIDYEYAVEITRGTAGLLAESGGLLGLDTRCEALTKFKSRCKQGGNLIIKAVFANDAYDGRTVIVDLDDGELMELAIKRNKAKAKLCCYEGGHTIALIDPQRCAKEKSVNCG